MLITLRLEAELEKDDTTTTAAAVADALASAAAQIRSSERWVAADQLDVPMGQLVYQVDAHERGL